MCMTVCEAKTCTELSQKARTQHDQNGVILTQSCNQTTVHNQDYIIQVNKKIVNDK